MLGQESALESALFRDEALDAAELQPLIIQQKSSSLSTALDSFSQPDGSERESEPFIPESVQMWRLRNIAVPCCYLLVGITQALSGILLNTFPLNLGATEAEQVTLSTVVIFPSTMKVVYGFLSDSIPIFGARRKPYMFIGYFLVSSSMLALICSSDLSLTFDGNIAIPPENAPSIELLTILFFILGVGLWLADVMGDSLVVRLILLHCR